MKILCWQTLIWLGGKKSSNGMKRIYFNSWIIFLVHHHTYMLLRDIRFSKSTVFFSLFQMGHDTHHQKKRVRFVQLVSGRKLLSIRKKNVSENLRKDFSSRARANRREIPTFPQKKSHSLRLFFSLPFIKDFFLFGISSCPHYFSNFFNRDFHFCFVH